MSTDYKYKIVATADNYQITLNQWRAEARTLLVTFDTIEEKKRAWGFGTSQAMKNNVDNLHVSQRKGTSYQYLSREVFWKYSQPVFKNYDRVLYYGHSLGGYATLYYSLDQIVDAFSICPRCPAHPKYNQIVKYSKYEQIFQHDPIVKNPDSFWTILWDPENIDHEFIEEFVGIEKIDRQIRVDDLGHSGAPKILTLNGSLQKYIAEWIAGAVPSAYPSFDEGKNPVLLHKKARAEIKNRKFNDAATLLEKSLALVNSTKVQNLLDQIRKTIELASAIAPPAADPSVDIAPDPR